MIHKGRRGVSVGYRCPDCGPMTCVARQCGGEVSGRLTLCHRAVVAAGARCSETAVIDPRTRESHGALVTSLTRSTRDDMVCGLPDRRPAVVTAGAISDDSCVIHSSPGESHRTLVAVLAGRIGDDVIWWLADRRNAVVACRAAAGDADMARFCIGRGCIW